MTFRKWTAVAAILIVLVAVAGLYAIRRERTLAVDFSTRFVESVLRDQSNAAKYKIPAAKVGTAFSLADTDYFDRTWFLWFKLETGGSLAVRVTATRGVGFIPLFNTRDTLAIQDIEFTE